jgi:hypothetical protein
MEDHQPGDVGKRAIASGSRNAWDDARENCLERLFAPKLRFAYAEGSLVTFMYGMQCDAWRFQASGVPRQFHQRPVCLFHQDRILTSLEKWGESVADSPHAGP